MIKLSKKGEGLIALYKTIANEGYTRGDGTQIKDAFKDFESRNFRQYLRPLIIQQNIKTILDYGCGGSDWLEKGFDDDGSNAREYYGLTECLRYEPARGIDERKNVDCVICFDVLEHIFIADLEAVITDIFSHASKLVILNIACYQAAALLPNGENAHITVRPPQYWKALIDQIALRFPNISILLLTSESYGNANAFPIYKAIDWLESDKFVT